MSPLAWIIALARVIEARARRSPGLRLVLRGMLAWLARHSREARAFVRLRVMRMI